MSDFAEQFRKRTKIFAINIVKFCKTLPKNEEAYIVKKQLIRSSTSMAANYRAACRARSDAEFFAKLCIVVEEADETLFWLEILIGADIVKLKDTEKLFQESEEILKIVSKSRKTFKENKN